MLDTIQNLVGTMTVLGISVSVIVQILKKIPDQYWKFPYENGDYGTLAAVVISIIVCLVYGYNNHLLTAENVESVAGLITGVIPISLGVYDLVKRIYRWLKK